MKETCLSGRPQSRDGDDDANLLLTKNKDKL